MNKEELTGIFASLGAREPERWAASQLDEDIPQLARYLFLKGAWQGVVADNEDWIAHVLKNHQDNEDLPYNGLGSSLKTMLEHHVPPAVITEMARCIAAEMLFHIGYLLDDPDSVDGNDYVNWSLFQTDDEGNPLTQISGLHESVLETDPTGREMRPRKT